MPPDSVIICLRAQMSSFYSRDDEINCNHCNTYFQFYFYFLTQVLNLGVLHLQADSSPPELQGKPHSPFFFFYVASSLRLFSGSHLVVVRATGSVFWLLPIFVPLMLSTDFEEGQQVKTLLLPSTARKLTPGL